jgi:Kef-type K+ transport system membrane component KefB
MIFASVFYEIAALLVFASLVGFIGMLLRQPLIVSFIVAGVLAGPAGLGIAQSTAHIELLAALGVAVLLFLVGLKLDLNLVRTLGNVALITGLGQVAFTSLIGYALCLALGFGPLASLYIAVALTFSSTIIIVKLLSDKREIDSLHGRIALGFLIVQDLVVVLAMMVLSAFGAGAGEAGSALDFALVLLRGMILIAVVGLFMRYAAEPLLRRIARSSELLVMFAIGWAALLAAVADYIGFGKELGGLLAGVSLASTPYRESIASRLVSLRDFMLLFFFIGLGSLLNLQMVGAQVLPAIGLALFVLIGNPLIVMIIMGAMGYRKRTGFMAGLTVAQISEFSLVFMAMGLAIGHVDADALGLVTLIGLITIGASTYMILNSEAIYRRLEPWLGAFERRVPFREGMMAVATTERFDVIVFGLGRYGGLIATGLRDNGLRVLGVDFDPEVVRQWKQTGVDACYGDAADPELLETLPLEHVRWVISAVPQREAGVTEQDSKRTLLESLRAAGYAGRVAVTAHDERDIHILQRAGATSVLLPFSDAASQAVRAIVAEMGPRPMEPSPVPPAA